MINPKVGQMVKVRQLYDTEPIDAYGVIIKSSRNGMIVQVELLDIVVKRLGCSRRYWCSWKNVELHNG